MLFSIIIPTFNRAEYLIPTLICLLNQKKIEKNEYEIIVVDSGNDESENMVRNLKSDIIHYCKLTLSGNRAFLRNFGAKKSKGEYLIFLDNDILCESNFLFNQKKIIFNRDNTVVLGLRRFLTEFDFSSFGKFDLINNYSLLNECQYYYDDRIKELKKFDYKIPEPWRFCYSFCLNIKRTLFKRIKGFDKKFGSSWGYEDNELGYRLQKSGVKFEFDKESILYHQPHFLKAIENQSKYERNQKLFLKIHNNFIVKLFCLYRENFIEIYRWLYIESEKIPDFNLQNKITRKNFKKLIVHILSDGFIENKKNAIILLINEYLKKYFKLSVPVEKTDIIFERLNFLRYDKIIIDKERNKSIFKVALKKEILNVFLPDVINSHDRYLFIEFCNLLEKSGTVLTLHDFRKIEKISNEDYQTKENKLLLEKYLNCTMFNSSDYFCLKPLSMNLVCRSNKEFNIEDSFFNSQLSDCSEDKEKLLDILACYQSVLLKKSLSPNLLADTKKFLVFMNNGYYEDGIDIALNFYKELIRKDGESQLIIKIPALKKTLEKAFSLHSFNSKFAKEYQIIKKWEKDIYFLNEELKKNDLDSNISIIEENYSILEIANLVAKCGSLINFSRGMRCSIESYISIFTGNKLFCGEHLKIYCKSKNIIKYKSNEVSVCKQFNLPVNSSNVKLLAYSVDTGILVNEKILINKNIDDIEHDAYLKICRYINILNKMMAVCQ